MSKKENKNDLAGFEEFIEFTEGRRFISSNGNARKRDESFELLTFLETESRRLEKIIDVLEEKIPTMKSCPQDIALTVKQETTNITLKSEITNLQFSSDSGINKNFSNLFRSFFGKKSK